MKKTMLLLSIVFLAGCQNQQGIKTALGKALVVGNEIELIEREKCAADDYQGCPVADRIKVWLDAGQQIYDTGSYSSNCDLMLSVSGIAYDWIKKEYPDKAEYRIPIALLRSRLLTDCEAKK